MKKYWTSLTEDYIPDWTPANAIREIVQNALDSPSPFEYSMEGDTLCFTSVGTSIPPKTLLMGVSGKRNDPNSVGGKGEGFKCAAIVLLREGYGFSILNGGVCWEPEFEYHPDFDEEVLVFHEKPLIQDSDNLTFVVTGADQSLIEEVKHDCLYLQDGIGEVKEGTRGRVLFDRPGKLYVGGLYVCDINGHKFSYDFHPRYLPLNRDRKSVENWNLGENTSKLLHEVFPAEKVAEMIEERANDVQYSQYHSHAAINPQDIYNACYQNIVEKHGDNVVVVSDWDDKERLEKRGFENVIMLSSDNHYTNVIRSKLYQERFAELQEEVDEEEEEEKSPNDLLLEWYEEHCIKEQVSPEADEDFEELIDLFKERGVQWVQ